MDEKVGNRMDMIELLAKGDDTYRKMLKKIAVLERRYDQVISSLDKEKQDIICDFISCCEEMGLYVLKIGCTYMLFPD